MSTNIQVAIRIRPLIATEHEKRLRAQWSTQNNTIYQVDNNGQKFGDAFSFDHIFGIDKTNSDIYDDIVRDFVDSSLNGLNSTIFAYGQTSSGKTYTMLGDKRHSGIMTLAIENIFNNIENTADRKFLIRVSYIEIYNEKIYDLLDPSNKDVKIREFFPATIGLQNIKEEIVSSRKQMFECLKTGTLNRHIASNTVNDRSSRSHTIFKITIESTQVTDFTSGPVQVSNLNLVDLAGSERVAQTKATGARLKEGSHINKSLSALGLVIRQLSDGQDFINFRDSKLTRLLQDSLGGNSKTLIIATITLASVEDTCSTLAFAQRAKAVKNKPHVNEILTDADVSKRYASLNSQLQKKLEEQLCINQKLQETQEANVREMNKLQQQMELIEHFQRGKISNIPSIPKRRHTIGFSTQNPLFGRSNQDASSLLFLDEFSSKGHIAAENALETIMEEDTTPMKSKFLTPQLNRFSDGYNKFSIGTGDEDNDALKKASLEEELQNARKRLHEYEIQQKELEEKFKLKEDLNEDFENYCYPQIIDIRDQLLYLQKILVNEKIDKEISNSILEKDSLIKSHSLELTEMKDCINQLRLELIGKEQLLLEERNGSTAILEENSKLKMELSHCETENKFLSEENDRLKTEIELNNKTLHDLKTNVNNLFLELTDKNKNIANFESNLSTLKNENKKIMEELDNVRHDNDFFSNEYNLLKEEHIQLKNEFATIGTENDTLKKSNEEMKILIEEYESVKQLKNKFAACCTERDSLKKSNEEMKMLIEEYELSKHDYIQLKNEFVASCTENNSLKKSNEEMKILIEEYESVKHEYIELKNKFAACCTERDSLKITIEKMKMKIEEYELLKQKHIEVNNEFAISCTENNSLKKIIEEMKKTIEEYTLLKQEYIELKKKFAVSGTENGCLKKINEEMKMIIEEYESLKHKHIELNNEFVTSCTENKSLKEEMKMVIEEYESLKKEFAVSCTENDSLKKSNEEMKILIEEYESVKHESIQLKNKFAVCCTERDSLKITIEEMKMKIEEYKLLKQKHIELNNEFAISCTENNSLKKIIEEMKKKIEEYESLKKEFAVSRTQNDTLKNTIEEMRTIFEEQGRRAETMKIRNDQLNLEIQSKEAQLKEKLFTMSSENNCLKKEIEKLRNDNENQKQKLVLNDLELQKQKHRLSESDKNLEEIEELKHKITQLTSCNNKSNLEQIIKYRNVLCSIIEYFISEQKSLLLVRHSQDERENFKSIIRDLKTNNATLKSQIDLLRIQNDCDLCAIQETVKKSHMIFKDYFSLEKTFLRAQINDLENTNKEYLGEMMALKDQKRDDSREGCPNCDKLQNEITRLTGVVTSQEKMVITLKNQNSTLQKENFNTMKDYVNLQQKVYEEQDKKYELQYTEWMKFQEENNKMQQREIRKLKHKIKEYEQTRQINKQSIGTECNILGASILEEMTALKTERDELRRLNEVQNGCSLREKIPTTHAEAQCNIFSEPSVLQEKYDLLKRICRLRMDTIEKLKAERDQLKSKLSN